MPQRARQEQVFVTGLCAHSREEVSQGLQRWGSFQGAGFRLEFQPLHLPDPQRLQSLKAKIPSEEMLDALMPPELRIITAKQERADLTATLLYAAHGLIDGCIPFGGMLGWDPYRAYTPQAAPGDGTRRFQGSRVVDVAGLAARLSRRRQWAEAAFSYLASVYLFSIDPLDFHPQYGIKTLARGGSLMHRVWEAQSLFAAYQVIECLDVVVKGASSDRPSVKVGVWDEGIRSDLESRLVKIGIPVGHSIIWTTRGRSTRNQEKLSKRTSSTKPMDWNYGHVRDQRILVIDAINHANWLRSNVTAHRSSGQIAHHHPMDTHNVQMLARMLLLSATDTPWLRVTLQDRA